MNHDPSDEGQGYEAGRKARTSYDAPECGTERSVSAQAAHRRIIDPSGLSQPQAAGRACVSCDKRWPRPSVLAGYLPTGEPLYLCEDCVIEPVAEPAPPEEVPPAPAPAVHTLGRDTSARRGPDN